MRKLLAGLVLAVVVCTIPGAFAQKKKNDPSRSVQGTVTASDDATVKGAVVQLKNNKTLQIRSFITQENGAYYFHELMPDVEYELSAEDQKTGSASPTKKLSPFDSQKLATINLKLAPKK